MLNNNVIAVQQRQQGLCNGFDNEIDRDRNMLPR